MAAEIEIAGVRAVIWDLQASNGVGLEKVAAKRAWIPTPGVPGLYFDPRRQVFYVDLETMTEAVASVALSV